jgi:hypothetical protein
MENWERPKTARAGIDKDGLRAVLATLDPKARDDLRRVLIRDSGSATLRKVPVRNAMAAGCALRLLRVNRQPDGTTFALMPGDVGEQDEPVIKPLIEPGGGADS